MLEVGDHDKPVVAPEVRDDIVAEDVREATLGKHAPGSESAKSSSDTNVGDNDLGAVALIKNDGIGVEVVGVLGVVKLTGSVLKEVKGPAEKLLNEDVEQVIEGGILENFREPLTPGLVNVGGSNLLLDDILIIGVIARLGGGLKRETATLLTGTGNKDLITGKVTSGSVVAGVRDPPRVVGDKEGRVKNPTNGVVDGLAGAETLVTALVSNNPNTSEDHTLENPVSGPGSEASESLLNAQRDVRGESVRLETGEGASDGGVNVASGKAKSSDHGRVSEHIGEGLESRALKAVSRDGREQVLDGVLRNIEGGDVLGVVDSCLSVRISHVLHLAGLVGGRSGGLFASSLTGSGDVGSDGGRHFFLVVQSRRR